MVDLNVNVASLQKNIRVVKNICNLRKLELVGILKNCERALPILDLFCEEGVGTLGVTSVDMAEMINKYKNPSTLLLALPSPNNAEKVVSNCKISLNSELGTIKELAYQAQLQNRVHEIILMVDIGDLREGLLPEEVFKTTRKLLECNFSHLKLAGLGANLGCCHGVLPSHENMNLLNEIALEIESRLSYHLERVSVGGSVMLGWLDKNHLPNKLNQLRIGEAILLGTIPGYGVDSPYLTQETFELNGQVLEAKEKPSYPIGKLGRNAFGEILQPVNKGIRKRIIVDFGQVHTQPQFLTSKHNIKLVTANSNYSVFDVTESDEKFKAGDPIKFNMHYGALIQSLLSPFVNKNYFRD